jgi:hypothetical protein
MKLLLFLLLFISVNPPVFAKGDDLIKVRKSYYLAVESEENLKEFENILINFSNPNNTILGYIGMSFMLKAKYAWLPNDKWEYFNKGKKFLESSISKDPNNIELKFMRFCIQNSTPSFLGYNKNLESDKTDIFKSFAAISDNDLKLRISNYMFEEKVKLTEAELKTLNK